MLSRQRSSKRKKKECKLNLENNGYEDLLLGGMDGWMDGWMAAL